MDLRELRAALRHGYRWVLGGAIAGVALAVLLSLWLPRSYTSRATVLLRANSPAAGAVVAGGSRDAFGGLAAALAGAAAFETELEVLESRAVMEPIVDSLNLQVQVMVPRGRPAGELFASMVVPEDVAQGAYEFRRSGSGYEVRGDGFRGTVAPGGSIRIGATRLTLRAGPLPETFSIRLNDRSAAVAAALKALRVERVSGDVAEIRYRAGDSNTAAVVPNAVVSGYLARRRTVDRGLNQTRYEVLSLKTDSVARDLALAEDALRRAQEQTGVVEPEQYGRSQLEQVAVLRSELNQIEAEMRALRRLASGERPSPRELAAFPTLIDNPAINSVLSRLLELGTERTTLLQRRTEADPDVVALNATIEQLERDLGSLSANYLTGLQSQQAEVRANLSRHTQVLAALPAQSQTLVRLQREVRRLGETHVALQTQLVQLRLAAVGEGGEVRMLDPALPPERPDFPNLPVGMVIGLLGGLFFGSTAALGAAQLRRSVRDPWEAELALPVPAVALRDGVPLLLGSPDVSGTVLVIDVGHEARAALVASRLCLTAALRGSSVALVELERSAQVVPDAAMLPAAAREQPAGASQSALSVPRDEAPGAYLVYRADGASERELRERIAELESQFALVVIAARGLEDPTTAALLCASRPAVLAAHAGNVTRSELQESGATLARLGIPVLGVVLDGAAPVDASPWWRR